MDLLHRVDPRRPRRVVDLGCGPGNLTALLAERWPDADVLGVDASTEMVQRALSDGPPRVRFELGDARDWEPAEPVDVLVANATYQWVPGHLALLPRLVGRVAPGGWFAFQVPGNFGEPSHTLLHELAADPRYASWTEGLPRPFSHDPVVYAEALQDLGLRVDAWETTYLHLLTGEDPVFAWVSGTGAGPILAALPEVQREEFTRDYRAALRAAYPRRPHGTLLPFRRVFVVARLPG